MPRRPIHQSKSPKNQEHGKLLKHSLMNRIESRYTWPTSVHDYVEPTKSIQLSTNIKLLGFFFIFMCEFTTTNKSSRHKHLCPRHRHSRSCGVESSKTRLQASVQPLTTTTGQKALLLLDQTIWMSDRYKAPFSTDLYHEAHKCNNLLRITRPPGSYGFI